MAGLVARRQRRCAAAAASLAFALLPTLVAADSVVKVVSCIGDSITWGACASNRSTTSYPVQLGNLLGSGYDVINFGDPGMTMLKGGLCTDKGVCGQDCSYWDQAPYVHALQSKPDIVTIMMGTNDAKRCNWFGAPGGTPAGAGTNFVTDYVDMIKSFKALPSKPKVFVLLPPPLLNQSATEPPPYNMSADVINSQFPVMQRQIAQDGGADGVIDIFTALGGSNMHRSLTCDGCHPTDASYVVIAQTVATAIQKSLADEITV